MFVSGRQSCRRGGEEDGGAQEGKEETEREGGDEFSINSKHE
jgi:hypothetical protein